MDHTSDIPSWLDAIDKDSIEMSPLRNSNWNFQLTQRLRALLHIKPLFEIIANHAHHEPRLRHYDALMLILKVFDLIIETTGLDDSIDSESVIRHLTPLMVQMDIVKGITPDHKYHRIMAEWILADLRNDANKGRPFTITYMNIENEQIVERVLSFWLIRERFHPDNRIVLHLSDEAVNLYLKALALDLQDAQAATEAVIQSQFERGRFIDAAASAREARIQTIRYQETIERLIRDTQRDLRRVDWQSQAPYLLNEALTHIKGRLAIEDYIISTATERLEILAPGSPEAQQVAQARMLVLDCWQRHTALHKPLMQAPSIFLDEQERQAFSAPRPTYQPDLAIDILEVLLNTSYMRAHTIMSELFPTFFYAQSPRIFSLTDLVARQLRPRREQRPETASVRERELVVRNRVQPRYPLDIQRRAQMYLSQVQAPMKLSVLLQSVTAAGEPVPLLECLALIVFRLFAPNENERAPFVIQRESDDQMAIGNIIGDDLWIIPRSQ